jgi:probable phosphoglycerate mutase
MIYLVRHGETKWNFADRYQGHLDSPLTPKGIEQSHAVGRTLRRVLRDNQTVCLETSPLGRAGETAAIVRAEIGIEERSITVSPLLIEHNLGDWQGLTRAEVAVKYPGGRQARESNKWHYVVPGGESYELVAVRARQWLANKRLATVTIAVTHEMISRAIQGAYAGLTPAETLERSHEHDRIYRLHNGEIEEIPS